MKITVNTRSYFTCYLKQPKGYGQWVFFMGRDMSDINNGHWFTGTFTEAKQQAVAKARELGVTEVTVGA